MIKRKIMTRAYNSYHLNVYIYIKKKVYIYICIKCIMKHASRRKYIVHTLAPIKSKGERERHIYTYYIFK